MEQNVTRVDAFAAVQQITRTMLPSLAATSEATTLTDSDGATEAKLHVGPTTSAGSKQVGSNSQKQSEVISRKDSYSFTNYVNTV